LDMYTYLKNRGMKFDFTNEHLDLTK